MATAYTRGIALSFALPRTLASPTRPPRSRTHALAHIQRTCADSAPGTAFASTLILGGGMAAH